MTGPRPFNNHGTDAGYRKHRYWGEVPCPACTEAHNAAKRKIYSQKSPEFPERHRQGWLSVENADIIATQDLTDCDFGVQISRDGRVWVCINGIAWLRFKPKDTSG
jgi:hypothetical protein